MGICLLLRYLRTLIYPEKKNIKNITTVFGNRIFVLLFCIRIKFRFKLEAEFLLIIIYETRTQPHTQPGSILGYAYVCMRWKRCVLPMQRVPEAADDGGAIRAGDGFA